MNKKGKRLSSDSGRRDFIKKKLFGGFLFFSGMPFLSLGNVISPKKVVSKPLMPIGEYNDIDWEEVRRQFPLSQNVYHLNTASIGPSPQVVIDEISNRLNEFGMTGYDGHSFIQGVHNKIAKFLNVSTEEIAITRNATEGMNIVVRSLNLEKGDEIIITNQEHIGGAAPWLALQKDIGVVIKLVNLDLSGKDNFKRIKNSITDKTKVVSFSHITFSTGMRLPAKQIVELCRIRGIFSCIDGAQAMGMIPIDLGDINPDFYTSCGHKWLYGPKGTGILFMNRSVIENCTPIFVGAYTDKKYDLETLRLEYRTTAQREEYGTRNIPIILGLGSAIDFISSIGIERIASRGHELANYFIKELSQNLKVEILTPVNSNYYTSIVTFKVKEIENYKIIKRLWKEESSFQVNGNHIRGMRLRGINENNLNGIRVSFGLLNNLSQVDDLLSSLNDIIE